MVKLLFIALFSAISIPSAALSQPIKVTVTTGMIGDLVQAIGADNVILTQLMAPGVDPHTYKPTLHDMRTMQEAEIIFYNGLFLEGKMGTVLASYGKYKRVVAVGEKIPTSKLRTSEDFDGHPDPHLWMDLSLWSEVADVVAKELTTLRPTNQSLFASRLKKLKETYLRLDSDVRASIGSIPDDQRVLLTAHDAFGYFGRAYQIKVLGIQGISTDSEAGLNDINKLVDFLVERKIRAVFVESSVSEKNVRALIEGSQARGHNVQIGGELYSDAMGEKGSFAENYLGMIIHNVRTITTALGGTAHISDKDYDVSR